MKRCQQEDESHHSFEQKKDIPVTWTWIFADSYWYVFVTTFAKRNRGDLAPLTPTYADGQKPCEPWPSYYGYNRLVGNGLFVRNSGLDIDASWFLAGAKMAKL